MIAKGETYLSCYSAISLKYLGTSHKGSISALILAVICSDNGNRQSLQLSVVLPCVAIDCDKIFTSIQVGDSHHDVSCR